MREKEPEEVVLRNTWYSVAPVTAFHLIVILLEDAAVAVTPVGAVAGTVVTFLCVVAETIED